MGGIGSGRRSGQRTRSTTDGLRKIDVRRWRRDGLLEPGLTFGWQWSRGGEKVASICVQVETGEVRLTRREREADGEWQDMVYPVRLEWTDCNLGGARPWFVCPSHTCDRRVAILYVGAVFACRHCRRLVYTSQNEGRDGCVARRADRVRRRLGWPPGILNGRFPKPKGMHWRTFERLCAELDRWESKAFELMAQRLGMAMPETWNDLLADA